MVKCNWVDGEQWGEEGGGEGGKGQTKVEQQTDTEEKFL